MDARPMEIDPIDGGPKERGKMPLPLVASYGGGTTPTTNPTQDGGGIIPMQISEEDEARQAIDMLRGEDVAARVSAANRLDAVAAVLGEKRTREVGSRCGSGGRTRPVAAVVSDIR
jgi:hypothetical protein